MHIQDKKEQKDGEDNFFSSCAYVTSHTRRKSKKLFIPMHQVLSFFLLDILHQPI